MSCNYSVLKRFSSSVHTSRNRKRSCLLAIRFIHCGLPTTSSYSCDAWLCRNILYFAARLDVVSTSLRNARVDHVVNSFET
jgi:hypothetical protein